MLFTFVPQINKVDHLREKLSFDEIIKIIPQDKVPEGAN